MFPINVYPVSHYERLVPVSDHYSSLKNRGWYTDGTTSIRLKFQRSLFVTSNLMTVQLCVAVVDSLFFMFLDPGCNDRPQSLEAYVTLLLVVRVENLYHIVLNTTWRTLSELYCRVV